MAAIRWTNPRKDALSVLLVNGKARVSNVTSPAAVFVYWQSANWLIDQGFAEIVGRVDGADEVEITATGREAAAGLLE